MHPREQNGACSTEGSFRQTGQDLESDVLRIPAMDGERLVASQGNSAANLSRKGLDPGHIALEDCGYCRMSDEAGRPSSIHRDFSKEHSGFERSPVGRQLERRRACACANYLNEAEPIHRRAFERQREIRIDRGSNRLPLLLSANRRKVDSNRPANPVAKDRTGSRNR